jgi:cysteine synthase
MIYESILDTIGRTPIVKLQRIPQRGVDIYVKVEAFNPA